MSKMQFRKSVVVAAISMMAAGGAFAVTGNTLVGPDIKSGLAIVNIDQVGAGNVVSADGLAGGGAFVVNTGTATLNLTVQQIGTATVGAPTGGNKIGLKSYSGAATIGVYQGYDQSPTVTPVTDNTADIQIGTSDTVRAGAVNLLVTQQSQGNYAKVALTNGFVGTVKLVQMGSSTVLAPTSPVTSTSGAGNSADLNLSGNVNAIYNIGQNGTNNRVKLTSASTGNVNVNIGDVQTFVANATASTQQANNTNAFNFIFAPGSTGVTASSTGGINLGTTAGFNLTANGDSNNVQVDFLTANSSSKVGGSNAVNMTSGGTLALYSEGGNIQVGAGLGLINTTSISGGTVAAYADGSASSSVILDGGTYAGSGLFKATSGGTISVTGGGVDSTKTLLASASGASSAPTIRASSITTSGVSFGGNSTLSATSGSTITVNGGAVNSDPLTGKGMSILQTDGVHVASITGTNGSSAIWDITQSGVGTKTATLTNSATGAEWIVAQSGTGVMELGMTNATQNGVIKVSQSGAANQTATGINFAAAPSSSFTLAQK